MRRYFLLAASSALLLALFISALDESRRPKPVALIPTLTGQVEYCLTCHLDLAQISKSHPLQTFGCVLCHGGERLALDANLAHSTMRGGKNPSDFSVVQASCGGATCHSGTPESFSNHIQRATTSIQATYAGAIANIRYTFGAQPDLKARLGIFAVQVPGSTSGITALASFDPARETNPYVKAFGQNCLTCHLSAQPLPGSEYFRFTGCAACHTPTQSADRSNAQQIQSNPIHKLTTAISYTQCDTCHNRGNYDLRTIKFEPRQDLPADRLHDYYQPIAQFTSCEWKLDCVDCHTRTEAMGDGNLYSVKKDIQYIQCKTCHGTLTELPHIRTLTDPNDLAFRLALLNPLVDLKLGDTILVTEKDEPLWNTLVLPDGTYRLVGKATGQVFSFKPVLGSACTQNGIDQSSAYCHTCHAVNR
ncbi:MAG TPA: multiheme c-type cytochrome [Anaerolineales bacterium]